MFVLLTYDVIEKRTEVFRALLSRYLVHEQNSVFAGSLGKVELRALRAELAEKSIPGDRFLLLVAENRHNVDVIRLSKNTKGCLIENVERSPDEPIHII